MASTPVPSANPDVSKVPPVGNSRWTSGPAIVAYLSLATLMLHLIVAGRYDFFRDEMYYIACSRHLAFGYVDQPPLIAVVVWLTRHILGHSLEALRVPAALAGAALVWLTGRITRDLGGSRFAQVLAAVCVIVAPIYLVLDYLMTMNAFSPLFWMGCAWIFVRIVKTGDQRLWLWFGALAGLGLENKYSMAVFGLGIVVGLLLGGERRQFRTEWIWLGGALAVLVFLPNLVWEIANDWPFLQLMRNIRADHVNLWPGTFGFFVQQFILLNLLALPVWLAGIYYFFRAPEGRPYRALGWAFAVVYLVFFALHGKDYYLAPGYPMMFAAGAIVLDRFFRRPRRAWLRPASVIALVAAGAFFAPIVLPILPVPTLVRYVEWFPLLPKPTEKSHLAAVLPQYFADQFGWRAMTKAVAETYDSLPPAERAQTAILGNNYGESAAIDLYGPRYGLPPSIGIHQNYWIWGPRDYTGAIVIVLGDKYASLAEKCGHVAIGAAYSDPYGLEHSPVLVCYNTIVSLQQIWPELKKWD